ncbi:peptidase family m13 domain-containing protein [Ditylenchus destructor]|nr:peptidase family m13 domain-containing protein [Ditylenchus destructor]
MGKFNTGCAVKLVILVVIITILLALALLCYWNFYREYEQVLGLNASKPTNNDSVDNGDVLNLELFETDKYLNLKMDISQEPCKDFYKYACGNNDENFHEISKMEWNPEKILQRALATEKDIHKHLTSVRNAQLFFNKCVSAYKGSDNSHSAEFLTKTIRRFEEKKIKNVMGSFLSSVAMVNDESINEAISDVLYIQGLIFNHTCTENDNDDRQLSLLTTSEINKKYSFLDTKVLMSEFADGSSEEVKQKILSEEFTLTVQEPVFGRLQEMFGNNGDGKWKVTSKQLANSLFYTLIRKYWLLPGDAQKLYLYHAINAPRRTPIGVKSSINKRREIERNAFDKSPESQITKTCIDVATVHFGEALSRIYVDEFDPQQLQVVHEDITKIVKYVRKSFQSMINQIRWITEPVRNVAIRKIQNLEITLLYSDITKNDSLLENYYRAMGKLEPNEQFNEMLAKLGNFTHQRQLEEILSKEPNRRDFLYHAYTDNAWYRPTLNSIVIPLGILHLPYYDFQRPNAINYGGIGMTIGHELSHGFDDTGVFFDEIGFYNETTWLNETSLGAFEKVAHCLIKQYSAFCPLSEKYETRCVNGNATLGENIGDNAGIHAAFRAMHNFYDTVPKDDHNYDQLSEKYTDEQLFFLGFATSWCETPGLSDEDKANHLITDSHSPERYRVDGTLPNFPAFRNAFKCEMGTKYAPKEFCEVWITQAKRY